MFPRNPFQISPEGAASILGRYKDDAHKAEQFPKDCQALATAQQIYAGAYVATGVHGVDSQRRPRR